MTGSWRTGWKAVRETDFNDYTSAYGMNGLGRLRYRFEEPARPMRGYGPLAVFKSLRTAREFVDLGVLRPRTFGSNEMIVLPCIYKRSGETVMWVPSPYGGERWSSDRHMSLPLPEGTDFADVVVLLPPGAEIGEVRHGWD